MRPKITKVGMYTDRVLFRDIGSLLGLERSFHMGSPSRLVLALAAPILSQRS